MLVVELSRKLVIRDDLVCGRGFDEVPVADEDKLARRSRRFFGTYRASFLDFSTRYRVKR